MTAVPLVSVVVLSYNYGRYLAQCIDSVLAQDYARLEVIVVDDGSTDESREVIGRYGSLVKACLKANGGEASSMNAGFALSRGEYVVFVDSDDYLLPGVIAAHVRALAKPGVVRSQAYLTLIEGNREVGTTIPSVSIADGDLRDLLLARGPGAYVSPPNSGNAWSRAFLDRVFPVPEEPRTIGGETYLMDTAPLFGTSVTLPSRGAAYRRHACNTSAAIADMNTSNIQIVMRHWQARVAWLARIATSVGHAPQTEAWMSTNWRVQTLAHLSQRHRGAVAGPALAEHLRSALSTRAHPAKRLLLAAGLLAIRYTPIPVAVYIAGRMIKLRYM